MDGDHLRRISSARSIDNGGQVLEAVGPYRIIAKLGEGGMGEVYLAEDTRLARRVAIKWLRDPSLAAPIALDRFRTEARAAARLTHPNIASVYDVIDTPIGPAIVMEYAAGESLLARLRRGPLPADEVMDIGAQLADALASAHEHGVIHRDLKPANICVGSARRVKVLDFGLARIRAGGTTVSGGPTTSAEPMMGTPGYCAPEQWLTGVTDSRADLFSLGVVLYEMCTGVRPLDMAYNGSITRRADAVNPAVPPALGSLIAQLLERHPQQRPQSAREVQRELLRLAAPATVPLAQPRRDVSRASAAFVGIAVLASAGTPLVMRARSGATHAGPPVVAVLPFHADEAQASIAAGLDQSLASDLSLMPGLVTIGRDAVSQYRGEHAPLGRIAHALGAQYLVDGDVREDHGAWTLDVRLARAEREDPVWRRQYTAGGDGLLAVRERISDDLAAALGSDAGLPRASRRVPTDNAEAFGHYAQGVAFLDRRDIPGNVDRAIRLFQSAVAKDSSFALAHAGLAQAYWEQYAQMRDPEMPRLAERSILEAVTLEPEHPSVRYTAAVIFNGTGRTDRAVEQLQRVVAAHPHDAAYRLLADITARNGDVTQALAYADRAIAIRPSFWENHGERGMICLRSGRFAEAREAFERVIALQPDSAWGYQLLGVVYQNLGQDDAALRNYQRSLELSPTFASWSNIGTLHYRAERYSEAADAYLESLKIRPNQPLVRRNLADTYVHLGERTKARGEYLRALELTQEALRVNPADARTLGVLATLEAKLQRHPDARRHIDQAIGAAPNDPELLYRRAVIAALAGDGTNALLFLQQALEKGYSRDLARADEDLGMLRARAGLADDNVVNR
jgi:tetratricopeptide (TPR) repeat protein/TolB-like protein/tRNA A-37 threonylcarbamoyl transferase component Bud32